MKLYRIFTESRPDYDAVSQKLAEEYFPDGFTVLSSQGVWHGGRENSLIIEVAGDHGIKEKARELAAVIKMRNAQQAVLMQELNVEMEFV